MNNKIPEITELSKVKRLSNKFTKLGWFLIVFIAILGIALVVIAFIGPNNMPAKVFVGILGFGELILTLNMWRGDVLKKYPKLCKTVLFCSGCSSSVKVDAIECPNCKMKFKN